MTAVDAISALWHDGLMAAQLFAVDPVGLGGVVLAAGPGGIRDLWFEGLRQSLAADAPVRRMPAGIEDDRLLGGIDLAATLQTGRAVAQRGLLAEADGGVVVIPMAERLSPGVAARIAGALDRHEVAVEREGIGSRAPTRIGIVAFDEGIGPDERVPDALLARVAFHLDFRDLGVRGLESPQLTPAVAEAARGRLASVEPAADEIVEALVATAARFGIASVVPPLLALRVARAAAAVAGRNRIALEDAVLAARLVLGPRATTSPEPETEDEPAPEAEAPADQDAGATSEPSTDGPRLEDILLAAVRAALPEGLLATETAGVPDRRQAVRRQGAGSAQASPMRGRPAGARPGAMRPGARLALIDTLRAAAPWQVLRRAETKLPLQPRRIVVRREDFRLKKFVQRREATIVFCVDASGSAAFHRLAESKGAVELLLSEAYAARTYAALVAFRGASADVLLPPTRSLSRAKSLLALLAGGGGTPLAAGIDAAVHTAMAECARGREPLIVFLSDGKANIRRDGTAARPIAAEEALSAARQVKLQQMAAVFIDTSPRPSGEAVGLAAAMGARYVALPYVDATAVRDVVIEATPGLRTSRAHPR